MVIAQNGVGLDKNHNKQVAVIVRNLLALLIVIVLAGSPAFSQTSVSLNRVNGLLMPGILEQDQGITFIFRLTNNSPHVVVGVTLGFRVWSPDGATWGTTSIDTTSYMGRDYFPYGLYLRQFSVDGSGVDTVGFLGVGETLGEPTGLPVGFDQEGLAVNIGPIPHESRGLTICIDSSFYFNGGVWKWVLSEPSESLPTWDGPHCFRIECCEDMGDVNDDGFHVPDISDIIYLVTYMFQGGEEPFCPEVVDLNQSGGVPDISDLTYMVEYMFQGGPPPPLCPGIFK